MITKNDEDYFMVGDDEVTKEVKDYMPPVFIIRPEFVISKVD